MFDNDEEIRGFVNLPDEILTRNVIRRNLSYKFMKENLFQSKDV